MKMVGSSVVMVNSILLIMATVIWGMGFVATRWALDGFSPIWTNSLRYILAALIATPLLYFYKTHKKGWSYLRLGFFASILIFSSVLLQTIGLKYTTVAKNSFITVFYAIATPLLSMFIYRVKFQKTFWVLVAVAIFGIGLMCDLKIDNFNIGDFYTFLCAVVFAIHILYLDKISKRISSAFEFNLLQCFFMGLMGIILAVIWGDDVDFSQLLNLNSLFAPSPLTGLIFLSVFSSIIAFSVQVQAQRTISSHIVALIFLLESPFAALFGVLILNESLSIMNMIGAGFVVAAIALLPFLKKF